MSEKQTYLNKIEEISALLDKDDSNINLLMERAKLYMKIERRDLALNDLKLIESLDESNIEAQSYIMMITQIDSYFYSDLYNP